MCSLDIIDSRVNTAIPLSSFCAVRRRVIYYRAELDTRCSSASSLGESGRLIGTSADVALIKVVSSETLAAESG
jgi:hypothetical protein